MQRVDELVVELEVVGEVVQNGLRVRGEVACVGLVGMLGWRCAEDARLTYLEEVEIATQGGAGCVCAFKRRLAQHHDREAYQRCEREQHRREDARESSDFAHDCGCVSKC